MNKTIPNEIEESGFCCVCESHQCDSPQDELNYKRCNGEIKENYDYVFGIE